MNHSKKDKNKLEKLRGLFFQAGLIISCGLTLVAFEWTTPMYSYILPTADEIFEEEWEMPPIIPEKEIEKPKVKFVEVKKKSEIIEIVKELPKEEKKKEEVEKKPEEPVFDPNKWKEVIDEPVEAPVFIAGKMPHYSDCASLTEEKRKKCTQQKMYEHFGKSIRVPENIKMKGKAEYKAYVYFEVSKKGEIENVKLLNQDKNKIPKELERQAYNAVKTLPKMIPGKNHGKSVAVRYSVPISFTIL